MSQTQRRIPPTALITGTLRDWSTEIDWRQFDLQQTGCGPVSRSILTLILNFFDFNFSSKPRDWLWRGQTSGVMCGVDWCRLGVLEACNWQAVEGRHHGPWVWLCSVWTACTTQVLRETSRPKLTRQPRAARGAVSYCLTATHTHLLVLLSPWNWCVCVCVCTDSDG